MRQIHTPKVPQVAKFLRNLPRYFILIQVPAMKNLLITNCAALTHVNKLDRPNIHTGLGGRVTGQVKGLKFHLG